MLRSDGMAHGTVNSPKSNPLGDSNQSLDFLQRFRNGSTQREVLFFFLNLLFWLSFMVITTSMVVIFKPTIPITLDLIAKRLFVGFIITSGMRYIYRQPFIARLQGPTLWLTCISICIGIAAFEAMLCKIDHLPFFNLQGSNIARLQFVRALLISIWTAFYFGFHLLEDHYRLTFTAVELEKSKLKSEMSQLQTQMNPHFLFNALNAVMSIRHEPEAVKDVVEALSDYLRFSLEPTRTFEPLSRELDSLEKYLTVQQTRFGNKLTCTIECDREASKVRVPPMIIQPVLENAFNYGMRTPGGPLQVRVQAKVAGDLLHLTTSNSGRWIDSEKNQSLGTGLNTLRERIRLLYDDLASVDITEQFGWVHVTIELPINPPVNPIYP
ncbi:MAG: histidine kinase [Akkermansiaceae bacterium]|nr:histidine kinase [Akkermansiaceae bacterium]